MYSKLEKLNNYQKVESFLNECGLSQYFNTFIEEGFDRSDSLLELTESDLIHMQVKRGHRRLIQRAILNIKQYQPISSSLISNESIELQSTSSTTSSTSTLTDIYQHDKHSIQCHTITHLNTDYFLPSASTMTFQGMSSTEEEVVTMDNIHRLWKRKYHRHAKPDINAPIKPPSAYVMFSNHVRAELKDLQKSFTDLAKIIGDRWKNISIEEKEIYELNALKSRDSYLKKIEEYRKTDTYKRYQRYILEFKAENEAAAKPVGRPRKRYKKDHQLNTRGTLNHSTCLNQKQYPFYLLNDSDSL